MTLTHMKKGFNKFQPMIINYSSYKHFSNIAYRESLMKNLEQKNFVNNDAVFKRSSNISLANVNKHAH